MALQGAAGSQVSTSGQTEENKKILRELEDQKRQLKMMKSQHSLPASSQQQHRPSNLETGYHNSGVGSSNRQTHNRQALHEAFSTSFGTFIGTDSVFGNPIMAVLPRLDHSPGVATKHTPAVTNI